MTLSLGHLQLSVPPEKLALPGVTPLSTSGWMRTLLGGGVWLPDPDWAALPPPPNIFDRKLIARLPVVSVTLRQLNCAALPGI